ncbi:hypothetical protein K443DRAFT_683652 [Laccaria amethystina LaAM-08-1]|uniref:Uncharacterized protein n=1 Tax=Laccaria amethystina LaAM-08-1 TaxID=1095629 RepID=A0A0C9WJE1_9AGAR|nr:hypothetical protein K443DRAFT_683652 [Laccaria amethystina LaAM-08-1]
MSVQWSPKTFPNGLLNGVGSCAKCSVRLALILRESLRADREYVHEEGKFLYGFK